MGTILNGILGGFSGKVGTVIGASWNGIDYMRSRASVITQPNTQAQLEQRARFGMVGKFLRPLNPFLRVSYKSMAVKQSAYNAALTHTLENAVIGTYPTFDIDYAKVLVCQGSLQGAENAEAVSTTANTIDFTWDDNSSEFGAEASDKAVIVVYSPLLKKFIPVISEATRSTGNYTMTLPLNFTGEEVQTYLGFCSADRSEFSNGEFLSQVIVS